MGPHQGMQTVLDSYLTILFNSCVSLTHFSNLNSNELINLLVITNFGFIHVDHKKASF